MLHRRRFGRVRGIGRNQGMQKGIGGGVGGGGEFL